MPKQAEYRVEWSKDKEMYEIIHGVFCFNMPRTSGLPYFLSQTDSFSFCSPTGHKMTLRKEKKQRGTGYWYAYKRVGGKVHKKYLGDIYKLDMQGLEMLARSFAEEIKSEPPPKKEPPRKPTLKFAKTLDSALKIYGFSHIPDRKSLITRYRELSKHYHPDHGGLHEDMVAVNLAYEYLKSFVR